MINRNSLNGRWPHVALGEVVEFLDQLRKPVTAKDREPGPYPYYGANGQQDSVADYIFDEPLVLLAEDGGYFGDSERTIAYRVDGKCWVNNHAHVLRPTSRVDVRFLCRHLESYDVTPFISGTTRQKLTKAKAEAIPIALPPLPEQKRIADILDKADAIRRKRQEAVNVFTPLIMACFRDCFGSSPEAAWKNTSFGDLVESTQLGLVRSSKEMSDEHPFPYLRMDALIGDGDLTLRSIKRVQATQEESEQYSLRSRDFLFNTRNSRELVGKTAVWHDEYESPVLFNNNIMRVRFRKEVDPVYMNYLFYVPQMRHLLEQRKSGTTSVFAIYYKNLKDLPIPVPPLELQGRFADFVNATLQWRVTSCGASTESQHLFDSLVQRAFKGVL